MKKIMLSLLLITFALVGISAVAASSDVHMDGSTHNCDDSSPIDFSKPVYIDFPNGNPYINIDPWGNPTGSSWPHTPIGWDVKVYPSNPHNPYDNNVM